MGRDIWLHSARDTARLVAAVLQEQPSDFALTARQIVALGRLPHRAGFAAASLRDAEVIHVAITRLDLTRFADHAFSTCPAVRNSASWSLARSARTPRADSG